MKKIKTIKTNNFVKKIFVKVCRILGYELIDQNNFEIPTLEKNALENISIAGKKSISIPLGQIDITRKVKSLNVYFRSCSKVNLWNQNKERIFEADKDEYALRSLYSILKSINYSKKSFNEINIKLSIIDDNSSDEFIQNMKKLLSKFDIDNEIISLQKNDVTQDVKDSNFASIKKCYTLAKENSEDLIYFVEDDYIHDEICILEMIGTYERIATQLNKEILLCPTDYPYLYTKADTTNIFLGSNKHWRKVEETLCTFLTSKIILQKYWKKFISMCQFEHYPFEQPLHEIYKSEYCLSPIPSLAFHCTNVNSVFGLSPNMNWKKIWEENKNY